MEDTSNYRNIKETYKIEGTIGRGSFATVKKAKNRASGVRFAVKVLSKKKMNDEDKISMQTEIDILKQMDHPNVVKLVDVFEDERHCASSWSLWKVENFSIKSWRRSTSLRPKPEMPPRQSWMRFFTAMASELSTETSSPKIFCFSPRRQASLL